MSGISQVKRRRPQSNFFGNRTISSHITVVMENDGGVVSENKTFDEESEHKMAHLVFVHVLDQCSNNSETVVTIVIDVLCRIKETDTRIKNPFFLSDNADCYHSANTLVSAK